MRRSWTHGKSCLKKNDPRRFAKNCLLHLKEAGLNHSCNHHSKSYYELFFSVLTPYSLDWKRNQQRRKKKQPCQLKVFTAVFYLLSFLQYKKEIWPLFPLFFHHFCKSGFLYFFHFPYQYLKLCNLIYSLQMGKISNIEVHTLLEKRKNKNEILSTKMVLSSNGENAQIAKSFWLLLKI